MPPSLADLTQRFLRQPSEAPGGDVEPYDVLSAFRVESRTAWQETLAVLKALGVKGPFPAAPSEWSGHVRQQEPVRFLPMALGHYPQMVSDLAQLLEKKSEASIAIPPKVITVLTKAAANSEAVNLNENAAELWREGKPAEAITLWQTLADSPVKAFNLGVAALAGGDTSTAKIQLNAAVGQLPEESGWKALAHLYLALAESED